MGKDFAFDPPVRYDVVDYVGRTHESGVDAKRAAEIVGSKPGWVTKNVGKVGYHAPRRSKLGVVQHYEK